MAQRKFSDARLKTEFDKADTDKDGYLTYEQALAIFDTGGPRDIELEEIMGRLMDKNYDGKISYEEFIDFAKKMHDALEASFYKRVLGNSGSGTSNLGTPSKAAEGAEKMPPKASKKPK